MRHFVVVLMLLLVGPVYAGDHQTVTEWCQESDDRIIPCVLIAPVVLLHELGNVYEAQCVGRGGEYLEGVGTAYPYQWGCEGADEALQPRT